MQYDYLDEFLTVAREGTLSGAALRLGVSQPSLGRHLSALEAELGTRLLERGPQGMRLTQAGLAALPVAEEIRALEQSLLEHFADPQRRVRERVLAVGCSYLDEYMFRLIDKTCERLKDEGYAVRVEAAKIPTDEDVARLLTDRDFDAVVCFKAQAPLVPDDAIRCIELSPIRAGVAVQGDSALLAQGELVLEDLLDGVFSLGREPGQHALWDEFLRACEERDLPAPALRAPRARRAPTGSGPVVSTRSNDMRLSVCDPLHPAPSAGDETAVPVADLAFETVALVRAEDEVALRAAQVAREISLGAGAPRTATQEDMYVALPKTDVHVGVLDRAERGRYLAMVLEESEVTNDLTLPDGTVVDKLYVALRNRLNRIGDGLSGSPVETSFEAIMNMWSLEDAKAYLEMPLLEYFTAFDYSVASGRGVEECERICEGMSQRNLIGRTVRGGVTHYYLLAWTYGIWEFMINSYDSGFLDLGIYGYELGSVSQFPTMRVCPPGPEAVRGGAVSPYWDWRSFIQRQDLVCVAPCQCRASYLVEDGLEQDGGAGQRGLCLTFGDMARYWLENGNARRLSKDECLQMANEAVYGSGCIVQAIYSKNPEVLCFCDAKYCRVCSGVRSTCGQSPSMGLASAYGLSFDAQACSRCGACASRCPMGAVALDTEGLPATSPVCMDCGQCVLSCPSGARVLEAKAQRLEAGLPEDLLDDYRWRSEDRMARGYIGDFTEPVLDVWAGM